MIGLLNQQKEKLSAISLVIKIYAFMASHFVDMDQEVNHGISESWIEILISATPHCRIESTKKSTGHSTLINQKCHKCDTKILYIRDVSPKSIF